MRRKRGMRKKHGIIMALLCMLVFVLTACGGEKSTTAPAEKDTLVVADGASPTSLDPRAANNNVSSRVMVQIYDTLVEQDENIQIQPGLAESWEQVDDVTTVFHLRKGIKFHNGEELKASDVKFSLEAEKASPQTSEIMEALKEVVVLDDYTVKVIPENPPEGSKPNFTENNKTNISPNQNTGIETPNKANTILILSTAEYCFVAEIIPIGIPITTAMITPNTANTKVFGNLEKISANTSLPVV